jgi:hypothetical protein
VSSEFDIYQSDLAKHQLEYDTKDYRRSLYTNTKPDHPASPRTEGPCNCERGDDAWERSGIAMKVLWPPQPGTQAPQARKPQRKQARGRSR